MRGPGSLFENSGPQLGTRVFEDLGPYHYVRTRAQPLKSVVVPPPQIYGLVGPPKSAQIATHWTSDKKCVNHVLTISFVLDHVSIIRSVPKQTSSSAYSALFSVWGNQKIIFRGPKECLVLKKKILGDRRIILGGPKECLVPINKIWGDRTTILGGTNALKFDGTKQGLWGD